MTASYTISSSGSSSGISPHIHHYHHHQASLQYSSEPPSSQPGGYGLDPVQQYARIIYEHTRRQLDSASAAAAAAQQSHRDARQAHRSRHVGGERTVVLA